VQSSAQNPRTSGLMTTQPTDFLFRGIKKCLQILADSKLTASSQYSFHARGCLASILQSSDAGGLEAR